MKTSSICGFSLAGALVLLICLGPAFRVSAQSDLPINVLQVRGNARYSSAGHKWRTVKQGMFFNPGVLVQTAGDSTLDLRLGDGATGLGSDVQLASDTAVTIERLNSEHTDAGASFDTEMNLRAGQILCRVGKLGPNSRYEVKFPSGAAGAHGGDAVCQISATGMTGVMAGQVVVAVMSSGEPQVKVVSAGKRFDPLTGAVGDIPAAPAGFAPPPEAPTNPAAGRATAPPAPTNVKSIGAVNSATRP
jgi:hypothetical protein